MEAQRYTDADKGNGFLGVLLVIIVVALLLIGLFVPVGDTNLTVRLFLFLGQGANAIQG